MTPERLSIAEAAAAGPGLPGPMQLELCRALRKAWAELGQQKATAQGVLSESPAPVPAGPAEQE